MENGIENIVPVVDSDSLTKMAMPRVLCRARLWLNNDLSAISKYSSLVNNVAVNKVSIPLRNTLRNRLVPRPVFV